MKNFESKMAQILDIPNVALLRLEYLKEAYGGLTNSQYSSLLNENIRYLEKHLGIDCFVSFSALNGESVSCAYMSLSYKAANLRFPNGIYAEIYGVYTRPEYRNKYLASQNIAILIEQGKKMDVSFVELDASSDGFGVYKRIGFVPADTNYKKMKYYYK